LENNEERDYRWIALSIASLGTLLGVLNASTLIIALPVIMVDLKTDLFGVMWVLISYMIIMTILAPAWGRLADIHGRKKLYVSGLAVFTISSLFCGISGDIIQLIACRVFQAIGGSLLISNGTIIVADAFRRQELGRAMGIISMIAAAAFVFGPILGGFLTIIDWRLNFFFNIPIGIIATWWAQKKLIEPKEFTHTEKFDLKGMLYFTLAFVTLMVYLSVGFMVGWTSVYMLLVLAVGLVSCFLFYKQEKGSTNALIDLSLFKNRIFFFGQISALINSIARGAVMLLLILYFQGPKGYDPLTASILIIPAAAALAVAGPIGGILSDKFGSREISTLGLLISFFGLLGLASMQYNTSYLVIGIWMFVNNFGSGLFQPPNTSAIMASVGVDRRGVASSIRAFLNNAGMVLSMVIATPLIIKTIPLDEMMNMFIMGGANMPVVDQISFTSGIDLVFHISAVITLLAVIASAMRGKGDNRGDIVSA
jgi:EmrB/QacA subfamily drug resistance transporter